ncbi:hypothetical protein GW17_00008224 [Ensete ventricosum]|nr:hypothetical protein GW17_00008224 [Ensete ventricosum]
MAKKKLQSSRRGDEGDRLFRCSSRRLVVTSWIRVVEGRRRQIRIEKGLRIEVLLILLLLTLLSTPSPSSFSFDASSLTVARLYEGRCGLPTNFDATYCYALGYAAGALLHSGKTGLISSVTFAFNLI